MPGTLRLAAAHLRRDFADLPPNPLARLEVRAEIEYLARQLAALKPPSKGESHGR